MGITSEITNCSPLENGLCFGVLRTEGEMYYYDEDTLMESFDKWDSRERRQRFLRRMEHKLNAKEQRRLLYENR